MKNLIIEDLRQQACVLESDSSGLPTKIKAIVQQADKVNLNRRFYSRSILEREIGKFNEEPQRRPGLVDHPIDATANVEDIGILWNKVWMEADGNVWGEGSLVETRKGNDLRATIKAGVEIGISSRGYASSKLMMIGGESVYVIGDDYQLETFDAVVDPGVADARIKYAESLENSMKNKELELTEEEVTQAEQEAAAAAELNESEEVVETPEVEAPVEEAADETETPAEETPVVEETEGEVPVNEALAALEEKANALEAELADMAKKLDEHVADAATARAHVANLETLLSALVQTAKDALDRADFYTACDFANVAGEASWLVQYLAYLADTAETESEEKDTPLVERAAAAFGKLFDTVDQALLVPKVIEACSDQKYGLVLVKRVLAKAESADPAHLASLVESESAAIDQSIAARRGAATPVEPKGNPAIETAQEEAEIDPTIKRALDLIGRINPH